MEQNNIFPKGNNLETITIILEKIKELNIDNNSRWFYIDDKKFNELFKIHEFTDVRIPFRIDKNEFNKIMKKLKSLFSEFKKIEEEQQKNNLLTNSEMDILIYKNYDDKISFAPYLYGSISQSDIKSQRKLIHESIQYYQNKNI